MKNVTINFGAASVTRQFSDGATVGDVVGNSAVRAALGYGDRIVTVIGGITVSNGNPVENNSTIVVRNAANEKALDPEVELIFGAASIKRRFNAGSTVEQVVGHPAVRAALGTGDNVVCRVNGVAVGNGTPVIDGWTIYLSNAANRKA